MKPSDPEEESVKSIEDGMRPSIYRTSIMKNEEIMILMLYVIITFNTNGPQGEHIKYFNLLYDMILPSLFCQHTHLGSAV